LPNSSRTVIVREVLNSWSGSLTNGKFSEEKMRARNIVFIMN